LEAEIAAAMTDERLSAPAEAFPIGLPGEEAEGEAAPPASLEELQRGTRLTGKIVALRSDDVFFDLGLRAPGVVSKRQFESGKPPEVGQQLVVVVDRVDAAEELIHLNLPRGRRRISGNWEALTKGAVVDCIVTGTNKGGLQVTVSNLRGFLPASQVDVRFISELEPYIGQKLAVEVVEVNPKKRNLVVSRRAVIERERREAEANLWQTLALGQTYRGTVKTVKDYGAFIDIGGVDAFLHVGEMSWNRIRHPEEVLSEGQEVEVQVISLDPERKRIGLGMKQLIKNPWQAATETYAPGSTVSGKVTRTAAFGAFIELEEGVEGLVHISELDHARVKRVTDVLREGQQVDVQVLEVDPERRRISLSLKALKEKQAEQAPAEEEPPPEQPQRRRRTPLKGGTGTSQAGGGLFGDPNRFK
ncbi:MAG: S1 RNA-binding domain-containing protein, partial [Planctomycetes bacterium]|nr:S1 RNA-binding domain-containing protein [Planctomycetota bacterium]